MYFLTSAICLLDSSIGLQKHLSDPLRGCSNICVTFMARSLMLLLTVFGALDSFAQNTQATDRSDIPVSFTLSPPLATCSIAKLKDVAFGVLGRPTAGVNLGNGINSYGYAVLDERFNDTYYGVYGVTFIRGTPTLGKLKITVGNANTLIVTFDVPSYLIMRDNESSGLTIRYSEGFIGYSKFEDGPWDLRGRWVEGDLTEEGDIAGDHYYQIGGTLWIYYDTPPGHYINTITATATCPE